MTSREVQTNLQVELAAIASALRHLAAQHRGQPHELLELLRFLEALHQELREGVFQEALPTNRQALYALLRDIETKGGWPYITRMKLSELLEHWQPDPVVTPVATPAAALEDETSAHD